MMLGRTNRRRAAKAPGRSCGPAPHRVRRSRALAPSRRADSARVGVLAGDGSRRYL
jgi:hypothetical protein